jgi:hypothetical protein
VLDGDGAVAEGFVFEDAGDGDAVAGFLLELAKGADDVLNVRGAEFLAFAAEALAHHLPEAGGIDELDFALPRGGLPVADDPEWMRRRMGPKPEPLARAIRNNQGANVGALWCDPAEACDLVDFYCTCLRHRLEGVLCSGIGLLVLKQFALDGGGGAEGIDGGAF